MAIVERSEFKGSKVLIIKESEDSKFPFTFGLKKAKLILESIEDIQAFVDENPS